MKYKVGDKVKIKSFDWYKSSTKIDVNDIYIESDDEFFLEIMTRYCGKEAIITRVQNNSYKIDLDYNKWNWTKGMFE